MILVKVVEFCKERGLKHRSVHKYIRVAGVQDGEEIKSMIDLVLMKRDILRYMQDVRAVREMRQDLSDHYIVLCKVRLVAAWIEKRGGGWG